MRCRNGVKENNHYNVVFFGSYGLNADGTAKKAPDYVDKQDAIVNSLTQKLSVLKGELWYKMNYGLPLYEKNKRALLFDSFVAEVISKEPEVLNILDFSSEVFNHEYRCSMKVLTSYGEISLNI